MKSQLKIAGLIACCGLAAPAAAQPFLVNISGATLLESFLTSRASTNDFVDLDGDGQAGSVNLNNEQLADTGTSVAAALASDYFVIQYTAVGSGNGIADLDTRGFCRPNALGVITDGNSNYIRGVDDVAQAIASNPFWGNPGDPNITADDSFVSINVANGFFNRVEFNNGGTLAAPSNSNNPRAYPVRSTLDGTYIAVNSTNDNTHGIQIDLAPTDVPIFWFVEQAGTPEFDDVPNEAGYGKNPIQGVSLDGSANVRDNTLVELANTNTLTSNPDNCTIFDNALTLAPVGAIVSYGVGISQLNLSEMRHGLVTGRLPSGENLVFGTRDSGSGTRNAFVNGVCLDPSWGMGDNVGPRLSASSNDNLSPNWQPTNTGGSSRMDAVVRDHRLATGHTGAERLNNYKTANNGTGEIDVLALRNDITGTAAATYNRPFIDNLLDNDIDNGYLPVGPGVIASIGRPEQTDPLAPDYMANQAAADYLRNINAAILAFAGDPGTPEDLFSPGEFLAFNFIPNGAADFIAGPGGPCDLIPAPGFNQALQDFVRSNNILGNDEFEFFDFTAAGRAPSRDTSFVYSDGLSGSYVDQAGNPVAYSSPLTNRNKISGDFNGDEARDADDIADIVRAYEAQYEGGPAWSAPAGLAGPAADFVLEIVGDFNGDGSFDIVDVRYFMDGLALDTTTGLLNRHDAFVAADNASFDGNVFNTTLLGGAPYVAGASAADVAGAAGTTPGFHPIGADGVVDGADIDYIFLQFSDLADAELDWTDTAECATPRRDGARRDLSADVNGDLLVNIEDVCKTLEFLGLAFGDLNRDGVVNAIDANIIAGNLGNAGGYFDGDLNGDGQITAADQALAGSNPCDGSTGRLCADQNLDGVVSPADFNAWILNFNQGSLIADTNQDGLTTPADFNAWILAFNAGANGPICNP